MGRCIDCRFHLWERGCKNPTLLQEHRFGDDEDVAISYSEAEKFILAECSLFEQRVTTEGGSQHVGEK
jgi:hypothetical protein